MFRNSALSLVEKKAVSGIALFTKMKYAEFSAAVKEDQPKLSGKALFRVTKSDISEAWKALSDAERKAFIQTDVPTEAKAPSRKVDKDTIVSRSKEMYLADMKKHGVSSGKTLFTRENWDKIYTAAQEKYPKRRDAYWSTIKRINRGWKAMSHEEKVAAGYATGAEPVTSKTNIQLSGYFLYSKEMYSEVRAEVKKANPKMSQGELFSATKKQLLASWKKLSQGEKVRYDARAVSAKRAPGKRMKGDEPKSKTPEPKDEIRGYQLFLQRNPKGTKEQYKALSAKEKVEKGYWSEKFAAKKKKQ